MPMPIDGGGGGGGGSGPPLLLESATGKVSFLRAHNVGSGWGPANDHLDVEVVMKLDTDPERSFGFQLRDDKNARAHQAMFDLLRDAFSQRHLVSIDFTIIEGRKNGVILRVASSLA
jgi:hypothetical protein